MQKSKVHEGRPSEDQVHLKKQGEKLFQAQEDRGQPTMSSTA